MSKVLKIWARKILFGPQPKRELPNDPLPGLSPPRPQPKPPVPYDFDKRKKQNPSIEVLYNRYQESNPIRKPPMTNTSNDPNWPASMSGI